MYYGYYGCRVTSELPSSACLACQLLLVIDMLDNVLKIIDGIEPADFLGTFSEFPTEYEPANEVLCELFHKCDSNIKDIQQKPGYSRNDALKGQVGPICLFSVYMLQEPNNHDFIIDSGLYFQPVLIESNDMLEKLLKHKHVSSKFTPTRRGKRKISETECYSPLKKKNGELVSEVNIDNLQGTDSDINTQNNVAG